MRQQKAVEGCKPSDKGLVFGKMALGKLEKVELRQVWNNEAFDFTTWLAEGGNLELLSDEIGIDIKLIQPEAEVGKFSVDILAEEENTGKKIIIENQLESSNHDHLGKILTYASGYDAKIIIWILKDIRDEHKRAIDWLNEHTDEDINFFAIKMELWKIGESPPAPKFQVVSQPNDWAKAIKKSASQSQTTNTDLLKLEFWNKFKDYSKSKGTRLRLRKVVPQHWYDISIGSRDAHISLTINTREDFLGCEIYIGNSKELFNRLQGHKAVIEAELGEGLEWMELPGKKASRIKVSKEADVDDEAHWEEYFSWLLNRAEKFHKVFSKYITKVSK